MLQRLQAAQPRLPVILMTAHGTTETMIEATKLGAYDYLLKPFEMPELLGLVQKALASSRLMFTPVEIGSSTGGRDSIVGQSRAMQEIYKEIGRVAAKPVTVLIRGETGTGKELVARALYQHSDRAGKPFIAVNCAAIPETLLESELFGHERGAFTGADVRRIGRFEQAHGGTIFLDEIGDLSPNTQAKLLRVLQGALHPAPGRQGDEIPIDARVARRHAPRPSKAAMAAKEFRDDLFYRLSVAVITLPPLRPSAPPTSPRWCNTSCGTRYGTELRRRRGPPSIPSAVQLLSEQPWGPGNIRELENVVRKALLLARGYAIGVAEIHQALSASPARAAAASPVAAYVAELLAAASRDGLENVRADLFEATDRELFSQAIKLAQGNQAKAARWLGVSRLTMRAKLTEYGLHPVRERTD